jgi:AP-5 complex subunit beta-1
VMTAPPPSKPLTHHEWETLIENFQSATGIEKWNSLDPPLSDHLLTSLLRKDIPLQLKFQLLIFLDEFSISIFPHKNLNRLIESLKTVIQSPPDPVHITLLFKEQFMISVTSVIVCFSEDGNDIQTVTESLVEVLLTVINRPNFGSDRHTRAIACECLRELERSKPCLLSDVVGHLWSLCQNERTHASQSYILLFTMVIHNIVDKKLSVSILNTSLPMLPFNTPQCVNREDFGSDSGLNTKELRRALAFLLEWPQVLTPCGMMEFVSMVIPVVVALELQPSMLRVQLFGMIHSYDPLLCHVVLAMFLRFIDAFDGQESEVSSRLLLISREAHHYLVFRLLAIHWLLGFNQLVFSKQSRIEKKIENGKEACSTFYPSLFDPLALKALKLDLLASCSVLRLKSDSDYNSSSRDGDDGLVDTVKVFEQGLLAVSSFKWLPPGSTEIAIAFRTFHKFLIAGSSHSDSDPSTTRNLLDSMIFRTLQVLINSISHFRILCGFVIVALHKRISYYRIGFLSC